MLIYHKSPRSSVRIEHRIPNPGAAGSNPAGGAKIFEFSLEDQSLQAIDLKTLTKFKIVCTVYIKTPFIGGV